MAIIPSGQKFFSQATTVDTTYGGPASLKAESAWYTMQDIADSVGGGGGGLGDLTIVANGTFGTPITASYYVKAYLLTSESGTNTYSIVPSPNLSIRGDVYPFTATTIAFPGLIGVDNFSIGFTPLQSISAPDLEVGNIDMGSIYLDNNLSLTSASFPKLKAIAGIGFNNNPQLINIDFSALERAGISVNSSTPGITGIYDADFPSLRKCNINFGYATPSFEIDLPNLTTLDGINGGAGANLSSVILTGVVDFSYAGVFLENYTTIQEFKLGTVGVTKKGNSYVTLAGCSLNQASVDNMIQVLASLDGTNGTTALYYGSLYLNGASNAAPSPSVATSIAALISRGWVVSTN